MELASLLKTAVDQGCSDIHIVVGMPPMMRKNGEIMPIDAALPALRAEDTRPLIYSMLGEDQRARLEANLDLGQVILLSELSRLALQPFDGEAEFVQRALDVLVPHLEGDWSVAVFLRDPFDEPTERVGAAGPHPESLPESAPVGEAEHRWLDAGTFCVALTGTAPEALGSLVARCHAALAPREKAEAEVVLTAAGRLLASALLNIRHDTAERLRVRLERARGVAP